MCMKAKMERLLGFIQGVLSNTTVEPVIGVFYLVLALSGIPGEELYLKKTCLVNHNNSREVCDNIFDHKEVQIGTQQYVSGVQVLGYSREINIQGLAFMRYWGTQRWGLERKEGLGIYDFQIIIIHNNDFIANIP